MNLDVIKTDIYRHPERLLDFITRHVTEIDENTILAITSKIVSLSENCLAPSNLKKVDLIKQEADHYLGEIGYDCHLTIKHGLFIASAGIDESNSENGDYLLYPKQPFCSAEKIYNELKRHYRVEKLGIILTDSHTQPLRKGVTGVSLAHWGFTGLKSYVGKPDLFGRELKMSQANLADGLAAAATVLMGEGHECQPLTKIVAAPVQFYSHPYKEDLSIAPTDDLYYPIYRELGIDFK